MVKYEFINEEKSIIRHNLVPELLIQVIRIKDLEHYSSLNLDPDAVFFEIQIKGWKHVFLLKYDSNLFESISQVASIVKRAGKWYKAKVINGEIDL